MDNRVKCLTCDPCVLGRDEYCENQKRLGANLDGGHAQYCKVPAINVHRFPADLRFEEASCLPLAGHTAWHCLMVRAPLQPWDEVLINAVGSSVGSFGLQIAKRLGARVIVTASSDWKLEKATTLGADAGINYTTTPKFSQRVKALTNGRGVDLVFDNVGAARRMARLPRIVAPDVTSSPLQCPITRSPKDCGAEPYTPVTSLPQRVVASPHRGNILCCPRMAGGVRYHLSGYQSAALESCAPPTESILAHCIVEPHVEGTRGQSSCKTLTIPHTLLKGDLWRRGNRTHG